MHRRKKNSAIEQSASPRHEASETASAAPLPLRERTPAVYLFCRVVLALLLAVAAFLLVGGLTQTSVIDPKNFRAEHILFLTDSLWKNLAVLLLLISAAITALHFLRRRRITHGHLLVVKAALAVWVFGLGCLWALSVRSVPFADSERVVEAARLAAAGDFSFFSTKLRYFQMFPYQLGIVAFYEPFFRLWGDGAYTALWLVNAAALAAGELALVVLCEELFPDRRAALFAAALLALCPQPILFTSFLYGNLPGFAAMLWACVLACRLLNGGRPRLVIGIAILCALGVVLKSNNWIGVTAIVLALLISLPERFRPAKLVCCAAVVLAPLLLAHAVQAVYEQRADVSLGAGTPQTAWLVMGLSESDRAPGWYNKYSYSILKDSGWETKEAKNRIAADLADRLDAFAAEPGSFVRFLLQKTLSQWNEPAFESIWISEVKEHQSALPPFAESVYDGAAGRLLSVWFEHMVTFVYAAFALGMFASLPPVRKRSGGVLPPACGVAGSRAAFALLPLLILGGFFYHLLFEAKSQYTLLYYVIMFPCAAFGLERTEDWVGRLLPACKREHRVPSDAIPK